MYQKYQTSIKKIFKEASTGLGLYVLNIGNMFQIYYV